MNHLSSTEPLSGIPDLTACEREPIHSPGAIEPNGAMLVLGEETLTILQASSNAPRFFQLVPEALLGMRLTDLFSQEVVHQFVSGIKADGERHYVAGLTAKSGVFLDALVHRYKGLLIIEFEPASSSVASGSDVFASLTMAMAELGARLPLTELCQRVAVRVRSITGFDRVMVYRFLEDDTGCVVAEDKRDDISQLGGIEKRSGKPVSMEMCLTAY